MRTAGLLCNGSTADFDSARVGSNPTGPVIFQKGVKTGQTMNDKETAELVYNTFSWIMNNMVDKLTPGEANFVAKVIQESSLVVEGWQEGE